MATKPVKKKLDLRKKGGSMQYLLVILAIGIALMLFGSFFSSDPPSNNEEALPALTDQENESEDSQVVLGGKDSSEPSSVIEYEHYYENKLKEALEDGYGISDVI